MRHRIFFARRMARLVAFALIGWLALAPRAAAQSNEGAFERTLKVSGPVVLTIQSGSGRIRVSPGAGDSVRIAAHLRADSSWLSGDATSRIREIEKNPPIEQSGNTIRVGHFPNEDMARHISISYDVTVPAETTLDARTGSGSVESGDLRGKVEAHSGSGSVTLGRVAGAVVASTGSGSIDVAGGASLDAHSGSGSIKAMAVGGAVKASTGSGGIRVAQAGKGDVDVSSGSGDIEVAGADGAVRVSASSGRIVVEGRPSAPWKIDSSSGAVTLRLPPDAAFDLDARVSSGGIDSAHPVTMMGQIDRRRLQGKVRGGGPLISVHTASGGIHIQ
ncbi:MAG: DUF4097 family beta strand repeat-containing protein [Bacteroidales bacterium]